MHSNDVFISYSRKDQPFVRSLDAAFRQINCDPWIDWEDIQKGEEWWAAIQRGIEGASTFVFVLSPDSVASAVCREEIDYAASHNKRFLPIVRREGFDMQQVHPKISSHNWLFFRETDDFNAAFESLQRAIATDLDYVRAHTRLLIRAVEWQSKQQNASYLLRGADRADAERWLLQGTSKEPKPTALQTEYVTASRDAESARLKASQKARRMVVLTMILANIGLAIAGSVWFYHEKKQEASQKVEQELVKALRMGRLGTNGDDFAALTKLRANAGKSPANKALYEAHQRWLAMVREVFPETFIRTYAKGEAGQILWIGDLSRDLPGNPSGTKFLKSFNAHQRLETEAFKGNESVAIIPYQDSLGRWISACGPIRNAAGEVVGGMRVDYTEDYLRSEESKVINTLLIAYLIIFLWLLILSIVIVRAMRSPDEMRHSIDEGNFVGSSSVKVS